MKLLIIGFQRSGTTLLRRILHSHPEVRRAFHEEFLLKKCRTKNSLDKFLMNYDIDPVKDVWGEKVPFYPSARGLSMMKYFNTWKEYFGDEGRVIHIVRHPIDVGLSVVSKCKGQKYIKAINIYKKIMPIVVPNLLDESIVYTLKYEDLLINPDKVVPKVFSFCGVDPEVDYKKNLAKITNSKYQKIDSSRAFAHRVRSDIGPDKSLQPVINILNRIPGPKYEL